MGVMVELGVNSVLATLAAALLLFVSGGVIYLSSVEWRDRRRRSEVKRRP